MPMTNSNDNSNVVAFPTAPESDAGPGRPSLTERRAQLARAYQGTSIRSIIAQYLEDPEGGSSFDCIRFEFDTSCKPILPAAEVLGRTIELFADLVSSQRNAEPSPEGAGGSSIGNLSITTSATLAPCTPWRSCPSRPVLIPLTGGAVGRFGDGPALLSQIAQILVPLCDASS